MASTIQRWRDTLFGLAADPEGDYVSIDDVAQLIENAAAEIDRMPCFGVIGVNDIMNDLKNKLGQ